LIFKNDQTIKTWGYPRRIVSVTVNNKGSSSRQIVEHVMSGTSPSLHTSEAKEVPLSSSRTGALSSSRKCHCHLQGPAELQSQHAPEREPLAGAFLPAGGAKGGETMKQDGRALPTAAPCMCATVTASTTPCPCATATASATSCACAATTSATPWVRERNKMECFF
jgi:hypothetical protein